MKQKVPLSVASILICLSISGCFDTGQTAGTVNSPTPLASPAASDSAASNQSDSNEPVMLKGPNAIPKDTRIVVNIPAFRMDVFREGTLLRSFKIGIGYQQFPLPTGFRKAEQIIFNPTWTQPNESWASDPGAVTPAGAAG